MRKFSMILLASTALVAACSDRSEESVEAVTSMDIEAPMAEMVPNEGTDSAPPAIMPSTRSAIDGAEEADASSSTSPSPGTIPVSMPQIAYTFAMGFRMPTEAIKPLQNRHADMCEARGPSVCRIISMRQAEREGDYAYGSLQLAVASSAAREFGKELEASSGTLDGELVSSSIEGEDLSKRIVDTEARLRSRTVLRDRLMDVLRNRRGSVEELVEAERGVAQVNEEIDQARSWLTEMRGRVAFSQMSITYEAGAPSAVSETQPGSFTGPIISAWSSLGGILGSMIGFFMLAFTVLAPFALLIYGGVRLWRWAQARGVVQAPA